MLTKAQQYYTEICRLCLMEPQDLELESKSLQLKLTYSEILTYLTKIEISKDENNHLPKGVCHECSGKLIQLFKFKRQIEFSYNKLCEIFETNLLRNKVEKNIETGNKINLLSNDNNQIESIESIEKDINDCSQQQITISSFDLKDDNECSEDKNSLTGSIDRENLESEHEQIEEDNEAEYIIDEYNVVVETLEMKDEDIEYIDEHNPNLRLSNQSGNQCSSDNSECEEYNFLALIEDNDVNDSDSKIEALELGYSNKPGDPKSKRETKKIVEFDISPATKLSDSLMQKLVNEYGVIKADNDANGKEIISYYGCKLCDKTLKSQAGLSAHLLVHTGLRPFECELCSKSFSQRSHLSAHIKIHEGIRPYACEICGRSFNKSSNLIRHKKIHNNEAEYSCEYCPKQFKWKSSLEVHTNSHTGEKPYGCHICSKVYTSDASLRKHCKRNHFGKGVKPLEPA